MGDFKLDTSGEVIVPSSHYVDEYMIVRFSDLSPFVQGYVEAALRSYYAKLFADNPHPKNASVDLCFRKLAPETLARIISDCAEAVLKIRGRHPGNASDGAAFWANRQLGWFASFPPLNAALSDDGRIVFL